MIRIYTEAGEFGLPEGFTLELGMSNPMLSSEGSASIPFTVPATPENLVAAGRPDLLSRQEYFQNNVECIVQRGAFQIQGSLTVTSCSQDEIGGVIAFSQSRAYASHKRRSLKDILGSATYNLGTSSVDALAGLIDDAMATNETEQYFDRHEIVALPVRCQIADGIIVCLDELEDTSDEYGESFGSIVYKARTYKSGDLTLNVPKGYGVTVFPYLCYIVRKILSSCGYEVKHNDFDEEPYRNLVLLHPCADLICNGSINLRDFVPDVTLGDFLTWLQDKFGAYVNTDGDEAGVYIMDRVLGTVPELDVTGYIQDDESFEIPEASAVKLTSGTSIDGASPVAESYSDFRYKFGAYTKVATNMAIGKTDGLYYCEATGDFWKVENGGGAQRIGSDAFSFSGRYFDETEKEYKPDDRALTHSFYYHYKPSPVLPFIGNACHYHTAVQGEEEKQDHPLLVCWAYYDTFWRGTATGWRSDGKAFTSLSPYGLYSLFWREYNRLLLNGALEVSATLNLPLSVLQGLDICRPVLYKGARAIIKSLKYSISDDGIVFGEAKLMVLQEMEYAKDVSPITL